MPKIRPVTIFEFVKMVKLAQRNHIARNEPIPEMRDENIYKAETYLKAPFQTFDGEELYEGFVKKAATLFYLLIKNHPLANCNKRLAVFTLVYFCRKNRRTFRVDENALYDLAIEVANSIDKDKIIPYI